MVHTKGPRAWQRHDRLCIGNLVLYPGGLCFTDGASNVVPGRHQSGSQHVQCGISGYDAVQGIGSGDGYGQFRHRHYHADRQCSGLLLPAPKSRVKAIWCCLLLSMCTENLFLAFGRNVWIWSFGASLGWIAIPLMNANLEAVNRLNIPIEIQGRVFCSPELFSVLHHLGGLFSWWTAGGPGF